MYAAFLYDAVYQYAVALNKTLARNEEPTGTNIISKLLNKEYNSKYSAANPELRLQSTVYSTRNFNFYSEVRLSLMQRTK